MSASEQEQTADDQDETFDHVSILEYNDAAEEHGYEPGERVIVDGIRRDTHVRDDEKKGFTKVADAVAIIELHQPLATDEVNDWCNSEAGKLALAHWFDLVDPEEVGSL